MAELEFKYLNEIDISDSLTDSAHVIVEDGGNIRRAPMNQLVTSSGVSSWNDLTDRPFYEEGSYEEILPETELSFVNYYGMYMSDTVVDHTKIVIGQTYTMIWDGITYTAPAFEASIQAPVEGGETITLVAIGNPGIGNVGEDNGIPFFGVNAFEGTVTDQFTVVTTDTAATHTLSISAGSTTIHTLDEKFIPDTIARVGDVGVTSWNELEDKPFGEESGGAVIEWDGNTEGLEFFTAEAPYYHVSDSTPTIDELIGASYETDMVDSGVSATSITSEMLTVIGDCIAIGTEVPLIAIATIDNAATGDSGTTISKAGVYFVNAPGYGYASKLTYGSTTIHTLDEKFIPDTIARTSDVGVKSWNDLTDKPFYEEGSGATIEWDGNTEGRDSFTANWLADNTAYYKVSDIVPAADDLVGGNIGAVYGGESDQIPIESIEMFKQGNGAYSLEGMIVFVQNTTFDFANASINNGDDVITAPSCGVYIVDRSIVEITSLTYGSTTVKTLDEKFIPDTIARKSDLQSASSLPEVTTENNGQILGVADGIWGVMDAPSGVSSWNDLTDRPIVTTSGEITWDGNTEDRDTFSFGGLSYYKIADIPSGKFVLTSSTDSSGAVLKPGDFSWGTIHHGGAVLYKGNYVFIVESTMIYVSEDNITEVPSPGIYFGLIKYHGQTGYTQAVTYKTESIDEKCIPDTIARKSDIQSGSGLPEVTTENNGAFLRVVDGAWAIVNMTDVSTEGA